MAVNKLTMNAVKALGKKGRYGDGGGLWLQVSKWGTKSWLFRFMLDGRSREMGLGPVNLQKHDGGVTLEEARAKRDRLRKLLREGIDPIENRLAERDARRAQESARVTFKTAAEEYIAAHEATWRNEKHRQQWRNTLKTYAYPKLGDRPVSAIDDALINETVAPIWAAKTETATRVKNRIKMVCKWVADGKPLPKKGAAARVNHHPALPYPDLPDFMERLRGNASISARALEFTILTAARTGAVIGATWDEIDLEQKIWTVPAARAGAKTDKPRRVPLSDRAIEILETLPREDGNDHIFVGALKSKGLSQQAMLEMVRGMSGDGLTVHGFRSTFKDWCSETTTYPNAVSEAALWHAVADKVEKAYRRGDMLEKRRKLMEAWDRYCATPPAEKGKVVAISGARRA